MNTVIKLNSNVSKETAKVIKSQAEVLEGVVEVKIDLQNFVLSYELNEWASDYDVMVKILEILEDHGVDAEPSFDGDETVSRNTNVDINDCEYHSEDCDCEHDHCEHDHEDCDCEHDHCEHGHEKHSRHGHVHIGCDCCDDGKTVEEERKERKGKIIETAIAVVVMITGIILSLFESTMLVSNYVCIGAFVIAGYEAVFDGILGIFKGKIFSEKLLMTVASVSAILLGEVVEASGIMVLYSIGEIFEKTAVSDANRVIDRLKALTPDLVTVLRDGIEKNVSPKSVKVGETLIIKAGEKNAIDGVIVSGSSSFDTKAITGESVYRDLGVGDKVLGGYVSVDGAVKIVCEKPYESGTLVAVEEVIKKSAEKKAKSEKFLEKFAKIYTPIVFILAIMVAFIPPIFAKKYIDGLEIWGVRAIMLLCVSCPCALVISVPLAYFCGIGNGAGKGVLIKSSETLEKLASCKTVVFDKTGTLTEGNVKVSKIIATKKYQGEVLRLASIVEKYSSHPLANAVKSKISGEIEEGINYKEIAGKGVTCIYNDKPLIAGNLKFLEENGVLVKESAEIGMKLYVAYDGEYVGVIVLTDEIRRTARGCIQELNDAGITKTVMLTGDNKETASLIRKELKMNKSVSELLPEGKVIELEKIISEQNGNAVAFVGDGINDAPVLSRADVGFAIAKDGLDIAIESADVVLSNGDLSKIPYTIKLAKRTKNIVLTNVIVSLAIKLLVMVLGVLGVTSSLWVAIGADVGMLILAILNSIRNKLNVI